MSAERSRRVTYLDSSAIVKLVITEPESDALRRYMRRRRPVVSSAIARTEVLRVVLPYGATAVRRARDALNEIELLRVNDRVLDSAGAMSPMELRSLDAIHLATALQFGHDLASIVSYDDRLSGAAREQGIRVVSPD